MKQYIPDLGSILELEEDWTFSVFQENRNLNFFKYSGNESFYNRNMSYHNTSPTNGMSFTLPRGTKLEVDRIFIRQNMQDWSSITLKIVNCPNPAFNPRPKKINFNDNKLRFWVKLHDYNQMNAKVVEDSTLDYMNPKPEPILSRGNALTWKEFKKKVNQRSGKRTSLWATGTVNGVKIDEILEIYYEGKMYEYDYNSPGPPYKRGALKSIDTLSFWASTKYVLIKDPYNGVLPSELSIFNKTITVTIDDCIRRKQTDIFDINLQFFEIKKD